MASISRSVSTSGRCSPICGISSRLAGFDMARPSTLRNVKNARSDDMMRALCASRYAEVMHSCDKLMQVVGCCFCYRPRFAVEKCNKFLYIGCIGGVCVHGHAFFGGDPCSEIVENTVGVLLVHENKYATIFLNEPVKNRHINGNFAMMMVKNLILGAMAFGCMAMIISACGGKRARGEKSRRPVVAVSIPPQQFL